MNVDELDKEPANRSERKLLITWAILFFGILLLTAIRQYFY